MELYGLNKPELKDKPLKAVVPPALRNKESLFDAIKKQDVLLHHPYSSFGTIVDFIQAAAHDPQGRGDQDVSLPNRKEVSDSAGSDRGKRAWQTGHGSSRNQSPL